MYDWNHLMRKPGDLWVRDVLACIQERSTGESLLHVLAELSCWEGANIFFEGVPGLDRWRFLDTRFLDHFQTCDVFSNVDAHVDARDAEGRTPLHIAIMGMGIHVFDNWPGAPAMVLRLIALGADCEAADHEGVTPLAILRRKFEDARAQGTDKYCPEATPILRLFESQVLHKAALAEQPEVQRVARRRL